MRIVQEALTFDDVLLLPAHSTVLPRDVSLGTRLTRGIDLQLPVLSAAMDTVTESRLAITLAQEGGLGIIHKNMTAGQQAAEVVRVKKFESGVIKDPITVSPETTIREVMELTATHSISGLPVVEGEDLVGIVTSRDRRFETDLDKPVSSINQFVAEEILPQGQHTVEVALLDEEGGGELYLRDLEFEDNDWFYVGMADLTLSASDANGPIDLLQGEDAPYDYDSNVDGRLAFFVNGKFGDHWRLTASADTREGPLDDIFSNFLSKSPDSLFRRLDEDYYYPTFGDDSTVQEMAPTMGKFFVRVSEDDNFGQWGNFKVGYMNNELAQVDRGLYGANAHYESDSTTEFGERRFAIDGFAAEPGTVASQEEFRGTGGSLYYLGRQDVLTGSERVRIEIRDKASGIVTGVRNLTPVLDYDIDYLQGRILLTNEQREFAGLDKRVALVGQVQKFEIWDEAVWSANQEQWQAEVMSEDGGLSEALQGITL